MAVVVSEGIWLADSNAGATSDTQLRETEVPKGTTQVIRGITVAAKGQSEVWLKVTTDGGTTWEEKVHLLLPAEGSLDLRFSVPLEIRGQSNFTPGEGETILTKWQLWFVQPTAQPIWTTIYLTRFTYA